MSTSMRKDVNQEYRGRLFAGLADALREKGLKHTQIGDIVRHARTSRRTFYEVFPDKQAAFVELIRASRMAILSRVQESIDREAPWDRQIEQAIDAYLGALSSDPALAATISRELPALGERGAALQHEGIDVFANLFVELSSDARMRRDGVLPVPFDAAVMLIGGILELAHRAIQNGTPLTAVGDTAKTMIKTVVAPRT